MTTSHTLIGGGLRRRPSFCLCRLLSGALLALAVTQPLHAQMVSRPVIQPLPPKAADDLGEALKALARNGRDLEALIAAGEASVSLGDSDAAIGFFTRASTVDPGNGRITAGLARLALKQGDVLGALRLFDEAERAGAPVITYAAERGLAYDLVGNNARAQQLYRQALALGADDGVTMRLALSQAIAGDQTAADATLLPLLQQQDLAAFRTRAFALAAVGKTEEAVSIAETLLPPELSSRMAAYLRYMPRLTRAQQAAAANLGTFPPAEEIGREDPRLLPYAGQPAVTAPAQTRAIDTRLIPVGEPLGQTRASTGGRDARRARQQVARPARPQGTIPVPARSPAPARTEVPQGMPGSELPPVSAQAQPGASVLNPEPSRPGLAEAAPAPATPSAPQPAAADVNAPPSPANLAQAFADFTLPAGSPAVNTAGAVDITAITPAREKPVVKPASAPAPKAPAKPKPPAHPTRHWVQVATGLDVKALGYDWKRISRKAGSSFKGPFVADWGARHRLLAGPYDSADAAQKAVTELKAKGVDSFPFTSDEGEAVNPLR